VRNREQVEARIGELNAAVRELCAPLQPQEGRAAKLYQLQGEIAGLEWALGAEVL
jgi:hypothetical protein